MTKKERRERRKARHSRRVAKRLSRRSLLKAGAAAFGLAASLMVPVPIKANVPAVVEPIAIAPTWERMLRHVGSGDPRLRAWVHDLVLRPKTPQSPLLLTGPTESGKNMFHQAMGLLLPRGGVVQFRPNSLWESFLPDPWLMVHEGFSEEFAILYGQKHKYKDHYLKWCLTSRMPIMLPITHRFDVRPPTIVIPRRDLIHRLEDEREASRRAAARRPRSVALFVWFVQTRKTSGFS